MQKDYFSTIRSAPAFLHLGVFPNQFHTWDAATVTPDVEILDIGKGIKKYRTKNRDALIGHPNIKCVLINDIDAETIAILETLPKLEHLQVRRQSIPKGLNLAGLTKCRMVMLSDMKKLENLDLVANMPALESLFVSGPDGLDISALSTLKLKEFALWTFLASSQLDPIFEQSQLEYLCVGRFKPLPENYNRFKELKNLMQIEINSSSHPFDFYAGMDGVLSKSVARDWKLLVRLQTACPKHSENQLLQASGSRQNPFCDLCSPKQLKKLSDTYEKLSGAPLPVPDQNSERYGMSEDGREYRFFS